MLRRILSGAAAGALVLGLAACGEGGEGTATTPPPSINIGAPSDGGGDTEPSDGGGTDTDEPTAAEAPGIPAPDPADYAGMDEQTPEGAEQAFRYYIAVLTWSRQTGESETLNALFSTNCELCEKMSSLVAESNNNLKYWEDAEIVDTGTANFESENYDIEVGYVFTISEHYEPESPSLIPAQEWTGVAGMKWNSASWIIEDLALEETGDEA